MTRSTAHEKTNLLQTARTPKIAITVGDVAGIGPEISLRAVNELCDHSAADFVLYGPRTILTRIADVLGLNIPCEIQDIGNVSLNDFQPGQTNATTGLASYQAVEYAIGHALHGKIDAMVTGPIQKEAWHAAGIPFPGHTELLADRTGTDDFCMMLTSDEISCCLATIHIPLADVSSTLSSSLIVRAIRLSADALSRKLGRPATVTVCGLNPHAGENGQFSHGEEENIIHPAIQQARELGISVIGPIPPDTAFTPAQRKKTDAYVCMYHDQGLIPLKALSFDDAVNVTLGLPIIRTSVDHGTALDLAWQGTANHQSMISAINFALSTLRSTTYRVECFG